MRTQRRFLYLGLCETTSGKKGEVFVDVTDIENDGSRLPEEARRSVFVRGRKPIASLLAVGSIGLIEADEKSVWGRAEPTGERWANAEDIREWQIETERIETLFERRAAEKRFGSELDPLIEQIVEFMPNPRQPNGFTRQRAFVDLVVAKLWHAANKR